MRIIDLWSLPGNDLTKINPVLYDDKKTELISHELQTNRKTGEKKDEQEEVKIPYNRNLNTAQRPLAEVGQKWRMRSSGDLHTESNNLGFVVESNDLDFVVKSNLVNIKISRHLILISYCR